MEIRTKYSIGDKVKYMPSESDESEGVYYGEIVAITVRKNEIEYLISADNQNPRTHYKVSEGKLFSYEYNDDEVIASRDYRLTCEELIKKNKEIDRLECNLRMLADKVPAEIKEKYDIELLGGI